MTDPIADLLTRIRNATRAQKTETLSPYSKMREEILKVLKKEKYISDYQIMKTGKFPELHIALNAEHDGIVMNRISRPGQRIYKGYREMMPVLRGYGIALVSTSRGIMTHKQAKADKLGGEVLAEIW